MTARPDVPTRADLEAERRGALALDRGREARTLELRDQARTDLADLTEDEFTRGLERLKIRQLRMQRILDTALIEGAHYGNPKDNQGKPVFKKPMLYKAGAEELRNLLGLTLHQIASPVIVATAEHVSVTVTLGIIDRAGRHLAERSRNCNTAERRFQKYDGKGPIFTDAREQFDNCLAMAEKRAGSLLTCEASGATAFLQSEDEMESALSADDKPITPWTEEERRQVKEAAATKGLGRRTFLELVHDTLGTEEIGTGADVQALLMAIAAWEKTTRGQPVKDGQAGYGETGAPPAAAAPGPEEPPMRSAGDETLDLELAGE